MDGGVYIAVHNSIPSYEIKIDTNLEIVACRIVFRNNSLTLCNVYFNDKASITQDTLNILDTFPSPMLILGDVNAKHPAWGSRQSDIRGDIINKWVYKHHL